MLYLVRHGGRHRQSPILDVALLTLFLVVGTDVSLTLEVRLSRNGIARHWTITEWAGRWMCRYTDADSVRFSGCHTLALAQAQKAEWEVEIAAAKADGWA